MSFRAKCPHCGCKMDAPDKMLGVKHACPKCQRVIVIEPVASDSSLSAGKPASVPVPKSVPVPSAIVEQDTPGLRTNSQELSRLIPGNFYVIVNHEQVLAYWKKSEGWQYRVGMGFSSARRNFDTIPEFGSFVLIEGNVHQTEQGHRLVGVRFFEIAGRGALLSIARDEAAILQKLSIPCSLTVVQKRALLTFIREHYFAPFTEDALEIIEFLTNDDEHTQHLGDLSEHPDLLTP